MTACRGHHCQERNLCSAHVMPRHGEEMVDRHCPEGQEQPVKFEASRFAAWIAGGPDRNGRLCVKCLKRGHLSDSCKAEDWED